MVLFNYSKIANDYDYAKVFEEEFLTSAYDSDNIIKFIKCDKDEVYEGMIDFHKI